MATETPSVAAAMYAYTKATDRYRAYLDSKRYDELPNAGAVTRLTNAMRDAERAVDRAVIALVAKESSKNVRAVGAR